MHHERYAVNKVGRFQCVECGHTSPLLDRYERQFVCRGCDIRYSYDAAIDIGAYERPPRRDFVSNFEAGFTRIAHILDSADT